MTHPEKHARPGTYLDTDDHGRLLEENRDAYLRERADRIRRTIEQMNTALEVVSPEENARLRAEQERLKEELEEISEELR